MTSDLRKVREPLAKRPFDFLLASAALALSSPLWLAISLAIYLEDRGTVFFFHERCGRNGQRFSHIKFRSMRLPDRQNLIHRVVDIEHDPRVTRVGKLLRAAALDELPELLNILRGEMSFVGPRPLPFRIDVASPYGNIAEVPGYELRSRVRPGLTGLAQVYAPKNIDHRHKFQYDNLYVTRMSLCLDLKVLLLSIGVTLSGGWEKRGKKV